jgi:hypothetical protein
MVGIQPLIGDFVQVNTKALKHTIDSATSRLECLKYRSERRAYSAHRLFADPEHIVWDADNLDVGHEIGCLYSLFLQLAEAVQELQKEHNE